MNPRRLLAAVWVTCWKPSPGILGQMGQVRQTQQVELLPGCNGEMWLQRKEGSSQPHINALVEPRTLTSNPSEYIRIHIFFNLVVLRGVSCWRPLVRKLVHQISHQLLPQHFVWVFQGLRSWIQSTKISSIKKETQFFIKIQGKNVSFAAFEFFQTQHWICGPKIFWVLIGI